jgi:hypothetical protein
VYFDNQKLVPPINICSKGLSLINFNDVTFLIQGRVELSEVLITIRSIKKNFPAAKILISTWEESKNIIEVLMKEFDNLKIIYSKDPGSHLRKDNPPTTNNVNRIIVSTQCGLESVKTKYVFKIRGDILFTSANSIAWFEKYSKVKDSLSDLLIKKNVPFKNRLLISNITTIDPTRGPKLLYHPCDWIMFGVTTDVKYYHEIPLMNVDDHYWYKHNKKPENKIDPGNYSRYMAEDYIGYKSLRRIFHINHEYYCDFSKEELTKWERIIGSLFIVLPNKMLGIENLKYKELKNFFQYKSYSYTRWKILSNIPVSVIENLYDIIIYVLRLMLYKIWRVGYDMKIKINNIYN